MTDQKDTSPSGAGFIVRVYWMFGGPVLLLFLLVFMFEKRPAFPALLDAAYLIALASLLIDRYIDIRYLNGQTGFDQPATMTHWRRYATLLGSMGVGAWILARIILHFMQ